MYCPLVASSMARRSQPAHTQACAAWQKAQLCRHLEAEGVGTERRLERRRKAPTVGTSKICVVQTTQAPWLDTLAEHLVPISLGRGPTFVPTFVWTHRTFATSQQVLGRLFTRYGCMCPYVEEDGGPVEQLKKTSS
ncbi:ral guanine nucleotide dissociation stimulator-like [Phyllostomus hastatus]|uniref:ral guanine nucleotide dissociation stimulator-like n=1 Tax=Phyllostomus hastatus TaxID=9423 RepID=UPI001E684A5D|nr:ral guanine nucleotide dissociation stimulator-like [Phyllostomus hastatus]